VLACGPGAVLSHRSAAELWAMRRLGSGAIEVTTSRKSNSQGGIHRHRTVLSADEVTERSGIPVTAVSRTIFDLAAVLPADGVEQAIREAERLRLDDRLSLEDLLARHPRRRGVVAIRECLKRRRELPEGVTRGELEARFLRLLDREGISRPSFNAWVMLGEKRYQADCLWRDAQLIVELDGYEAHGTQYAFEQDRDRDRRLQAAGFRVMHVTWRQLHEIPDEVADDLQILLDWRGAKA
jgi:very-short-patch-repair endonuclease